VYPVIFIDAIGVKVRDGQVRNKPIYVVIGVTVNGERDILGLWLGDGGEGAKFWLQVLTRCAAGLHRRERGGGLGAV
jgi:transposase-like protein